MDSLGWNFLLGIPLLIGAVKGFRKGLLRTLVGFLSVVIALMLAFRLMETGVAFLQEFLQESGKWMPFLAFALIFIITTIVIHLAGKFLKTVLDMTLLGSIDNLAGAVLGILQWAFLISLILWIMDQAEISLPDSFANVWLIDRIEPIAPWVFNKMDGIVPFSEDLLENISTLFKKGDS